MTFLFIFLGKIIIYHLVNKKYRKFVNFLIIFAGVPPEDFIRRSPMTGNVTTMTGRSPMTGNAGTVTGRSPMQ